MNGNTNKNDTKRAIFTGMKNGEMTPVAIILEPSGSAAIIGFAEITRAGQIINNATFQPLMVFSVVAAIYFALCWPLSLMAARMERRHAAALAR